jgi:hypothetical protein
LVGSSSRSRLPPERRSFARWTAREVLDELLLVAAAEVEPRDVLARVDLALAELDHVLVSGDLLPHRVLPLQGTP